MIKDAKKLFIIILTIMTTLILCGCATKVEDNNKFDVVFESDIVELVDYEIEFHKANDDYTNQVDVTGRISNKLNDVLNVKIIGEFYDKNDQLLGQSDFRIIGLREKGKLGGSTTFTLVYDENNAANVDHVDLTAIQTEI